MELSITVDQYNQFVERRGLLYKQIIQVLNDSGLGRGNLEGTAMVFNYLDRQFKIIGLLGNNYREINFTTYQLVYNTDDYPRIRMERIDALQSRSVGRQTSIIGGWDEFEAFGLNFIQAVDKFIFNRD